MNLTFNRRLLSSVKRGINASMSLQIKNAPQFVRFYSVQQPSDASTEVKATENSSKAELSPEDQFKILYERSKRKVWGGLKEIRDSSKYVNQKLKRKEAFSNTDIDALLLSAKWINDYHNVVRVIKAMHNAHRVFKFRHVDVFVEAFLKAKKYDLMIRTLIEPELSFGAYLTNDTANMLVQELLNIPEQAEHAVKIVSSTTKRGLKVISKDVLIKVAQYQVEKGAEMKEILRSAKFILPVNEFEEFKSQFETKKDEKEVEEVKEAKEAQMK